MRESSNPVFRSLPKTQGGYATFGTGAAGYGAQQVHAQQYAPEYLDKQQPGVARPLTIDDVVTRTGISLAIVSLVGVVSYFLVAGNPGLMMPTFFLGSIGGLVLVLIATFGRKQDNPAIVLSYAAFEGLFVGSASFLFANLVSSGGPAMIFQAVVATFGVFFGMLVVYKTGAIRVTPKFTRMIIAGIFGVVALAIVNILFAIFTGNAPLTDGGPLAIGFSLLCIGLAAFSFLIDFDAADQMIRAGAPEKAAWGIALGLTVTLVWLYIEILRLLSYFNND
ncbi:Bax inhibitor-1/YccA family protein [Mycolicibacterium smegmatis]|uniref:Conserved transmembrane protein n=3 Tax=Mycolicibacterium smegmatis TaxID=1772 RepID=I7FJS4_MYCS2|nr:Bax inhibitor-1/YccA family protein [Mycolicibacterium smegmatis]ABK72660.1 permease of the major facilitator superfamily protein [Mycolicibacterium smegmatis MC2 155]AFP41580.1 Conserved transmembrane protein [Mycolicibacterium smegmatis MC2 155]AIU10307.1 membrane protein [Mycolicibacterium smegmatis MC2 155]AIU16932.1 membrane protein [Mycolicibacterium smegmatis]AIU23555.1 membrane protein [Mycolicibacterium smegmatis]